MAGTSHDEAALALKERVIARELSWRRVELAAYLGADAAAVACALAYPPRTLPAPDPEARGLKRALAWVTRTPPRSALARWAPPLEQAGAALHVRAAVGAVRAVLPAWEQAYPSRPEPRRALAAAEAWSGCPCDDHARVAEQTAAPLRTFRPAGPTPAPAVRALAAEVLGLVAQPPGFVEPDLADVLDACAGTWAAWSVRRESDAARAAAIARGANDYEAWQQAREAAEAAGRRAVEGEAEHAIRSAVRDAVAPWLLAASPVPELADEDAAAVDARRRARPRRAPAATPARASSATGRARSSSLSTDLVLVPLLFGGGPLAAIALADALEHARRREADRGHAPEDPDATWECPRCTALTFNTLTVCRECGYRLA